MSATRSSRGNLTASCPMSPSSSRALCACARRSPAPLSFGANEAGRIPIAEYPRLLQALRHRKRIGIPYSSFTPYRLINRNICTRRPTCRRRSIEIGRCRHSPLRGGQSAAIGDAPIDGFFPGTRVPLRQQVRPGIESRKFLFSKFDSGRLAHDCPPSGYFNDPLFAGATIRRGFQHPYAGLSVR